jgi:2-keto-4-pentenoate hydratase
MDQNRTADAAALIWRLWRDGDRIAALPADLAPATRAEGYAIQARLDARGPRFGWKIAATSLAGQKHIGVDGPLAGRLLAEQVRADGATIPLAGTIMHVAEPEFAFRMARALPPRAAPYAVEEVLDAVGALHLAIEVPDTRFTDFARVGAAQLLADNACAHLFVHGPEVTADWRATDLAAHQVHVRVGTRYTRDGIGANVLGDPRIALTWIANELSALGIGLAEGEVVTTGTCAVPLEIQPGDAVEADFGPFGRVTARFTD